MPLYEFECEACGHTFEDLVRNIDEEAQISCPVCKAPKIRRLLSATARGLVQATGNGSGGGSGFT